MCVTNIEELHKLKEQYRDTVFTQEQMMDMNEDFLLEMSVIRPNESGLPYELWLDPSGKDRGNEHTNSPRLKVKVDNNYIPLEISDNPDIPSSVKKNGRNSFPHLGIIKKYVVAYKKALLAHYFKEINDEDIHKYVGTLKQAPQLELKLDNDLNNHQSGKIEYFWDTDEMLYNISVVSEDGAVINTSYAFDNNLLNKELYELRNTYEISKIIDLGAKK